VVEARIPLLLHPGRRDDTALLAAGRGMARETGANRFLAQQEGILHRADARPWLPDITCPTLVLGSRDDAIVPAREIILLANGIPGAELAWLDVCGHLSPLEHPGAVARALAEWLERPLP
jgi:pimeloyl-ACP methyl ester carboxylesterase